MSVELCLVASSQYRVNYLMFDPNDTQFLSFYGYLYFILCLTILFIQADQWGDLCGPCPSIFKTDQAHQDPTRDGRGNLSLAWWGPVKHGQ